MSARPASFHQQLQEKEVLVLAVGLLAVPARPSQAAGMPFSPLYESKTGLKKP